MNNFVIDNNKCSGCKLCKSICPKDAIEFKVNEEGFWYPEKNEKCIKCGLCEKNCPMITSINSDDNIEQQVFCAKHKNEDIIKKSASGGAFSAIAEAFCDNNYVIFGAKYNEDFEVVHSYIENIDEIDIFRKSKYVQSDSNDTYCSVKKFLENGKKVLFSGTPCQIAALKKYLQKDYENLLTVDIICHGAPSPKVFKKYKMFLEERYKAKIKEIIFKKEKDIINSRNIFVSFENEKKFIKTNKNDLYLKLFYNNMIYRKSCAICKFANPKRYSDITLGDAWGIEKKYEDLNPHKGVSLIIVNTQKGMSLFRKLYDTMEIKSLPIEFAINENSQFREPTKLNNRREDFFANLDTMRFDKLVDKFCGIKFTTKLRRKLLKIFMSRR